MILEYMPGEVNYRRGLSGLTILLVLAVQFGPHEGTHSGGIQTGKGLAGGRSHGESGHDEGSEECLCLCWWFVLASRR